MNDNNEVSERIYFEEWARNKGYSIEKYDKFPFSYKVTDVGNMWIAWKGAKGLK